MLEGSCLRFSGSRRAFGFSPFSVFVTPRAPRRRRRAAAERLGYTTVERRELEQPARHDPCGVDHHPRRRGDERVDFRVRDVPGQDRRPGRGEAPLTIRGGRERVATVRSSTSTSTKPASHRAFSHAAAERRLNMVGRPSKSRPATFSKRVDPFLTRPSTMQAPRRIRRPAR